MLMHLKYYFNNENAYSIVPLELILFQKINVFYFFFVMRW